MSVITQTAALERNYDVEPYFDQQAVDFNDPTQVASCLFDSGDYDGYSHDSGFSETDVFMLALEDAATIIKTRAALLEARRPLQAQLERAIGRITRENVWANTRYLASVTVIDPSRKIS